MLPIIRGDITCIISLAVKYININYHTCIILYSDNIVQVIYPVLALAVIIVYCIHVKCIIYFIHT